jgi:hypothetical protein
LPRISNHDIDRAGLDHFCRTVASSRPALDACDDITTPARPVSFR